MILPPRRGPPCCALSCASSGSSRCVPTPTRPRAASRPTAPRSRAAALMQGVARVLSGDLDGGDASLEDAASVASNRAPDVAAVALCDGRWWRWHAANGAGPRSSRDGHAPSVRGAGTQEYYATPLVCAVTRVPPCTGETARRREELVIAQRLRLLLTYALPHFAVQARIELARVHLALSDPAGAWTLMREVDELLRCRPDLGNLVGEAEAFRARLSEEHGPRRSRNLGADRCRVASCCRCSPATCRSPRSPRNCSCLAHTVKSEAISIYRKLGVSSRAQAVARSRELGLLPGDDPSFIPSRG